MELRSGGMGVKELGGHWCAGVGIFDPEDWRETTTILIFFW